MGHVEQRYEFGWKTAAERQIGNYAFREQAAVSRTRHRGDLGSRRFHDHYIPQDLLARSMSQTSRVSPRDIEQRYGTRHERYNGCDYASIVSPLSLAGLVEVTNESQTGFGLVVDASIVQSTGEFSVGQRVELSYEGARFEARIRHVTLRDGGYVIGVDRV